MQHRSGMEVLFSTSTCNTLSFQFRASSSNKVLLHYGIRATVIIIISLKKQLVSLRIQ